MSFRCGYVGLLGRPNAGKSTLLNQVLGSKLAITSAKPQTTRNRIAGVHTDPHMQAVIVDTPGIHDAWTELNKSMVERASQTLDDVDVVCWVADMTLLARRAEAGEPVFDELAEAIAAQLEAAGKPIILAANKMDVVPQLLVLPVIDAFRTRLPNLVAAIPMSALNGDGVAALLDEVRNHLPEHPPLFPEEHWTDHTERFLCAEIIREKIIHLTEQEIPYSTFVEIEQFDEADRAAKNPIVRVHAVVVVERGSQKGIVIGKGGEMLKRIGSMARKDMEAMLGCRVFLKLFVKVERDWTKSKKGLKRVGFDS